MQNSSNLIVLRAFGDEENPESGTQNTSITETPEFQEALKAHLARAVEEQTAGLKNKLSEVLGEKKKTQEQLNSILAQAEDEQDQAALKAGKLDVQSLLDKKIAARDQVWQQKLAELDGEKEELLKKVEGERTRFKQSQIKSLVINEALKNEFFQPTAAEDLAFLAANAWDLTESGDLVSRDRDGNIALGKNGAALTPKEWIESLSKTRPHYFKQMSGAGSKPSSGGSDKTYTRVEWQNELAKASPKDQKDLMIKRAKGEIVITG